MKKILVGGGLVAVALVATAVALAAVASRGALRQVPLDLPFEEPGGGW